MDFIVLISAITGVICAIYAIKQYNLMKKSDNINKESKVTQSSILDLDDYKKANPESTDHNEVDSTEYEDKIHLIDHQKGIDEALARNIKKKEYFKEQRK